MVAGPPLTAVALRLPLINQLDYADAWFYSGYAWAPHHHFLTFGWTYFSVRFPAILAIGGFERVFGVHVGYVLLRWLLAAAAGLGVFVAIRRFASAWVATATVLLLFLDPFFSRMLLWDYSGFVTIATALAGFGVWWWSDQRPLIWSLLAGALLAAAAFADPAVGTIVFAVLVVETITAARLRGNGLRRLALRLGAALLGSVSLFFAGYLTYRHFVTLTPDDLVRPTIDFLKENDANAAPYQTAASKWLLHELRVWPPVVVCVALVAALRRDFLTSDVPARIAQACVASTAVLWLYRAVVTSSTVETWWAYDLVAVVVVPALGVLVYRAAVERGSALERRSAFVAIVVAGVASIVIRAAPGTANSAYAFVARHPPALVACVGVGVSAALLLAVPRSEVRVAALGAVIGVVSIMSWAPSILDGRGTTGVFVRDADREWWGYAGAHSFVDVVRDYDAPGSRVYTWYPKPSGLTNIGWSLLPQDGRTVQLLGYDTSLAKLPPLGRSRLLQPDAAYVIVLSTRGRDLRLAMHALVSAGFRTAIVRRATIADSHLRYVLVHLTQKPTG